MTEPKNHLDAIWNRVSKTDQGYTKPIVGKPYRGTTVNVTYLIRRATEVFGPIGLGFGWEIDDERIEDGADGVRIHIVRLRFWYVLDGKRGEVVQFGQTAFVSKNKNGLFTDEDAPKKSVTDAIGKCLSYLGFSADIYTGEWDDNRHASTRDEEDRSRRKEEHEKARQSAPKGKQSSAAVILSAMAELDKVAAVDGLSAAWEANRAAWEKLSPAHVELLQGYTTRRACVLEGIAVPAEALAASAKLLSLRAKGSTEVKGGEE
jgi:hypothetical protein